MMQDPSASDGTDFAFRRLQSPGEPIVVHFRQTGQHTANDNWQFTGNVTVNGTVTNTGLTNAIAARQPLTIYSDTPPQHTPGLEWVDTTDLRSYRSYNNLWIEIDRS